MRRRRRTSSAFLLSPERTIRNPVPVVEERSISVWAVIGRRSFLCLLSGSGKPDVGARAGAPGSTTRDDAGRIRGYRAPSSLDRHVRPFPEHSLGRPRLPAGALRTSAAGGAGARAPARARPSRRAGAETGRRRLSAKTSEEQTTELQ